MADFLNLVVSLSTLAFVIGSMLTMGFTLTVQQIITPLRNAGLIVRTLLASFVLVPLAAYLILQIIPLSSSLATGLICLSVAAGAPFLPKLIQVAKADLAAGVGLMVLLMVVTIVYMPLVLPLLLPGVDVDPWAIMQSLLLTMLLPLAIGLFVRARYPDLAASLEPITAKVANLALVTLIIAILLLNFRTILSTIGTGAILAGLLFVAAALVIGYLLGGRTSDQKALLGLATGQRNISAAIMVASTNFTDPNVLVMIIIVSSLGLILLMCAAGEFGKRHAAVPAPAPAAPRATTRRP